MGEGRPLGPWRCLPKLLDVGWQRSERWPAGEECRALRGSAQQLGSMRQCMGGDATTKAATFQGLPGHGRVVQIIYV